MEMQELRSSQILNRLQMMLTKSDAIEILSQLSISKWSTHDSPKNWLRELPYLHFLAGLYLRIGSSSTKQPTYEDMANIAELTSLFFDAIKNESFGNIKSEDEDPYELVLSLIRSKNLLDQVNYNAYSFQIDDYLRHVFYPLDDYFLEKLGFRVGDAQAFSRNILNRYTRKVNEKLLAAEMATKSLQQRDRLNLDGQSRKRKSDTTKNLDEFYVRMVYDKVSSVLLFKVDDFCTEEMISDSLAFSRYIEFFSCKPGSCNAHYNSPMDDNIIFRKPIIDTGGKDYFVPIPDLLFRLHIIFDSLLKNEGERSKTRQKYRKLKSDYLEKKATEYLERIFPKRCIFRNLKYSNSSSGSKEIDILVHYDNTILIIECKSGALAKSSRRGAKLSLSNNLKRLIEEANEQGASAIEYLKTSKNAIFTEKDGKQMCLDVNAKEISFFIINVTFEPLWMIGTDLANLHSLGLFAKNKYPWSVNLFDLDMITRCISSPTIFMHYLEKRMNAQEQNIFLAPSEMEYLVWYLNRQHFEIGFPRDLGVRMKVKLPIQEEDPFDQHFIFGKPLPKLKIDNESLRFIRKLERINYPKHSNIIRALLNIPQQNREEFLKVVSDILELKLN
ncbi:MAG: nuclease-related domain-containing protein [Nitrososphaera sp.]